MKLMTLTPIHIGSGETLKPLSYITEKNSLYVLDMNKFFAIFTESQRKIYLDWMEPILDKIVQLDQKIAQLDRRIPHEKDQRRELQRQRHKEEEKLSIQWFIQQRLGQNPSIFAQKCSAYRIPYTIAPRRDGFKTHIKDSQNRAYIPGSEIKGAIRTSLLYTMLQDEQSYKILKESLIDFRSLLVSNASPKKKKEKLKSIANVQSEDGLERRLLRGKKGDAKFDFFKFIRISDTGPVETSNLKIELTQMLGTTRQYTKTWIEIIVPEIELDFDLSIEKNLSIDHLGLKHVEDWLSLPKLLGACYQRTKEILDAERKYFHGKPKIQSLIDRLNRENQAMSPLIRLGAGQGFLGTTIDLKVLKNDPVLYDEAIREGVSFLKRWKKTQKGNFPKTRRVIMDSYDNPMATLGWVKLIPN